MSEAEWLAAVWCEIRPAASHISNISNIDHYVATLVDNDDRTRSEPTTMGLMLTEVFKRFVLRTHASTGLVMRNDALIRTGDDNARS